MISTLLIGFLAATASAPGVQAPAQSGAAIVKPKPMAAAVSAASATPSAITFLATDPTGTPVVTGSSAAVVTWKTSGGLLGAWTLNVSAPTAFGACSTVPASAVTVTCASVSGGFLGACSSATTLSPTATQIAGGYEGLGTATYSVSLSFTLQDSWKYIASSSCSLSVSYTITAN